MSLIRQRRNRKKNWLDTQKMVSTRTLVIVFVVVVAVIWYLSYRF